MNNKKGHTFGGIAFPALFLTLLLFAAQTESRPSTENEAESDIAVFPADADNVELHHVKMVDGVMHEDHPIVMYKEDFVSENYEPNGNETKAIPKHKKYRHLQRIRHQHSRAPAKLVDTQQEKILFDVLPETPILSGDDDDSGADNYEAAQLVEPAKDETLQKYPKKYHSRQRRQVYHSYNSLNSNPYVFKSKAQSRAYLPVLATAQNDYHRYPVAGKKPVYKGKLPYWQNQPAEPSLDNRIGSDDKDTNSIFHNSNPDDADFTIFDQPRPGSNQANSGGSSTSGSSTGFENWQSPPEEPEQRPSWGPSSGRRPTAGRQPVTQAPPRRPQQVNTTRRPVRPQATNSPATRAPPRASTCVWAIVNCCSQGSTQIRYNCFEEFGCHGAFWGVNPCAENVRDGSLALVSASKVLPQPDQSAASWATPTQSTPEDALLFPAEVSYQTGSACHRASKLCCKLPILDSLYECFLHQQCDERLSDILAMCS